MTTTRVGCACCSTDKPDVAAQRAASLDLGVAEHPIYLDRDLAGPTRARLFQVARATVYRVLKRAEVRAR